MIASYSTQNPIRPSYHHQPLPFTHTLTPAGESEEIAGMAVEEIDFGKKCLHLDWHPTEDVMAVAGLNNLYIYSTM